MNSTTHTQTRSLSLADVALFIFVLGVMAVLVVGAL